MSDKEQSSHPNMGVQSLFVCALKVPDEVVPVGWWSGGGQVVVRRRWRSGGGLVVVSWLVFGLSGGWRMAVWWLSEMSGNRRGWSLGGASDVTVTLWDPPHLLDAHASFHKAHGRH